MPMKRKAEILRALSFVTQFGITMLTPIFLCTFLGILVDDRLGISCFSIVGFFLGALAGFTGIWRLARTLGKH